MSNRFVSEFLLQTFQLIIFLFLVGFFGIYIFNKELLGFIAESAGISLPIFLLFIVYTLITVGKVKKARVRRREELEDASGESAYSLYREIFVSQKDEMKNDLLALLTAVFIIVIAWLVNGKFDYPDVLQAVLAFIAIYATKDIYFKKGIFGFGNKHIEEL